MKKNLLFLFLIMGIFAFGQNKSQDILAINQIKKFKKSGFELVLKDIFNDSRCPGKSECIWAGEVSIAIEVYKNKKLIEEKTLVINQKNKKENNEWFEKYINKKIKLIVVLPSTKSNNAKIILDSKKIILKYLP